MPLYGRRGLEHCAHPHRASVLRGDGEWSQQMGLTVRTKGREELGRADREEEARERARPPLTNRAGGRALQVVLKPATVWRPGAGLLSEEPVNLFSKSWYTGPSPERLAGHSSQSSSHPRRWAEPDPIIIPMPHFLLASLQFSGVPSVTLRNALDPVSKRSGVLT